MPVAGGLTRLGRVIAGGLLGLSRVPRGRGNGKPATVARFPQSPTAGKATERQRGIRLANGRDWVLFRRGSPWGPGGRRLAPLGPTGRMTERVNSAGSGPRRGVAKRGGRSRGP